VAAIDFTVRYLQSLKPQTSPYDLYDKRITGLGIRVSSGGKKTFFVRYLNDQGRYRKLMLGPFSELSLADARTAATEAISGIRKGNDPQEEVKRDRDAATFGDVAELFIEYSKENNRPRTAAEDERYIRKELLPNIGSWKLTEIRRRDIIILLEKVKNRKNGKKVGAPIAANRLHQVISRIYEFAVNRDFAETNPVYRLKKLTKEKPRNRILSDHEIKKFLTEIKSREDDLLYLALHLTLMLARRRSEIFGLRWNEIEDGIWTIPADRSKNKRAIPVPLPKQAISILNVLRTLPNFNGSGFVFPSPVKANAHFSEPKKSFTRLRNKLDTVEHFTIHDLRRTAATRMRTIGIMREDVEAILGHAEGRLIETYQCEFPFKRMASSLQRWANYLDGICKRNEESFTTSNVIPLRAMGR